MTVHTETISDEYSVSIKYNRKKVSLTYCEINFHTLQKIIEKEFPNHKNSEIHLEIETETIWANYEKSFLTITSLKKTT